MEYGIAPTDHRLPAELRLGTVSLQVSDLDRSLEFYAGLLGFHVAANDGEEATLGAAGSDEPLLHLRRGASGSARRGRLGLYHFAVLLPDRPALGRMLAHLARAGVHPGAADHLVSEALYLQDPDDLGIEIYRDRPRAEWRTNGRQLAMSSDPLDARSIVASAGGTEWTGMPEGTRIGHVHLHVGALDEARAFYHNAFGLDVIVWSYPGALFMSAGGYHHHLGVNTWAGPQAAAPGPDEPRLLSWEIVLPSPADVENVLARVQKHGYAATREQGVAADPWGTEMKIRSE